MSIFKYDGRLNRKMKRRYKLTELKKIRELFDCTQLELANVLGVSPQYISALERGLNELTYYDAYLLSKHLGKTPDELFFNDAKNREIQERKLWKEEDAKNLEKKKEEYEKRLTKLR